MSRGIRRTVIVAMVLITVFLIFSSGAFSKTFVKIDLEGLKNVHIRADIYEETSEGSASTHGAKHGRIQVIIREETTRIYNYKFQLSLRKAARNAEYEIRAWTDLPDIEITVYGDGSLNWFFFKSIAFEMKMAQPTTDPNIIETSIWKLGLEGKHEYNTGMVIMTDDHGFYRNIKAGTGIEEMSAIEWLIDFGSPILQEQLIKRYPEHTALINWFFSVDRDFEDFGIEGVMIEGGIHDISMGTRFVNETHAYRTEDINFQLAMSPFYWWAP